MTPVVQICIVVVSLAFTALVIAMLVAMSRLGRNAARLTQTAELSMAQVERAVSELRELVRVAREVVPPTQRTVQRFEVLGSRIAAMSTVVLEEIEAPVHAFAAVVRGVRASSTYLLETWGRRLSSQLNSNHGVHDDE